MTKICPVCDKTIKLEAIKCRYCKSYLIETGSEQEGITPRHNIPQKKSSSKLTVWLSSLAIGFFIGIFIIIIINTLDFSKPNYSEPYYLNFDGKYVLSQNWDTPANSFDKSECQSPPFFSSSETCGLKVAIIDGEFSFYDRFGTPRRCVIYQNHLNLHVPIQNIIANCSDTSSFDELYELIALEGGNLIVQEFPSKYYKILLEPTTLTVFNRLLRSNKINYSEINDLSRDHLGVIIDNFPYLSSKLIANSMDSQMFIYEEEIQVNDGEFGAQVGEIAGGALCSAIGLEIFSSVCSTLGSEILRDTTYNDGSILEKNFCINYENLNSAKELRQWISICEIFRHPADLDYIDYVPRVFTEPKKKFWSLPNRIY